MNRTNKMLSALLATLVVGLFFLSVPTAVLAAETGIQYAFVDANFGDKNFMNGWSHAGRAQMSLIRDKSTNQAMYCIAPGVPLTSNDLLSSQPSDQRYWNEFPEGYNQTIDGKTIHEYVSALLYYGYHGTLKSAYTNGGSDASEAGKYLATKALIWETVVGERNAAFQKVSTGGKDSIKSMFVGLPSNIQLQFESYYAQIATQVINHKKIPSFMGNTESNAPASEFTHNNRRFSKSFTDSNSVMSDFTFTATTNSAGINLDVSGNTLTVWSDTPPAGIVMIQADKKDWKTASSVVWRGEPYVYGPDGEIQDVTEYKATIDDPIGSFLKIGTPAPPDTPKGSKTSEDELVADLEFRITGDGVNRVVITNQEGKIDLGEIGWGEYTISEINTPPRYRQPANQTFVAGDQVNFHNALKRGGVKIRKVDAELLQNGVPQGDGSLGNARFAIKNIGGYPSVVGGTIFQPGTVVTHITTGEDGIASTASDTLSHGAYEIYEVHPSLGYRLDDGYRAEFKIETDGQMVDLTTDPVKEPVIRGGIRMLKIDREFQKAKSQGDATLAGAVYEIINESARPVRVNRVLYNPGQVVGTITTDVLGIAETARDLLPYGTYRLREKTPSEGYLLNETWSKVFYVRSHLTLVDVKSDPSPEQVIRGGVKVRKVDTDFKRDGYPQGDAQFKGATFEIVNKSEQSILINNIEYKQNEVVSRIYADEHGIASTASNILPYGTYNISETDPPEGYHGNDVWNITFTIREEGKIVDLTTTPVDDPIFRGGVQVQKWDLELDRSEALGGANHGDNTTGTHLEGIVFEIKNESLRNVYVDGREYEVGAVVKEITTHWNEEVGAYTAETTADCLPYGTYSVRESKTTDSYLLTDGAPRIFTIREDGKIVTTSTDNQPLVWKNQVVRGDFELVKIAQSTSQRLQVPFALTNITTGEQHVFVTDRNGEFSSHSEWNLHSNKTNANDNLLDYGDDPIPASEFQPDAGIWFSLGEEGSNAAVNDRLAALPYGDYLLEELRAETNLDYKMQRFYFTVYRNNVVVDLGTITNEPTERIPEMKSLAVDKTTGEKQSIVVEGERATIIDTLWIEKLQIGTRYVVLTTLVDRETGDPILSDGREVTKLSNFVPEEKNHQLQIELTFDSSLLSGKSVVVFQELYLWGALMAEHKDLEDLDQTVYFPEIKTKANESESGEQEAFADGEVTIIDTVSYNNLIVGKEYTINGVLMVKSTEKPLLFEGEPITGSITFTPEKPSGFVEIAFVIPDASVLRGDAVVVFEDLYYEDILVYTHHDINDEDQTVGFPEIGTTARDQDTGINEGQARKEMTIIDKVSYTGLQVGKTYKLSGVLMSKETEKPLLVDGKEIRSELIFVPEQSYGFVELTFTFDSSALEGQSVVFENLYRNGILVATHSDINDLGQTVKITKPEPPEPPCPPPVSSCPPTSSTPSAPPASSTPSAPPASSTPSAPPASSTPSEPPASSTPSDPPESSTPSEPPASSTPSDPPESSTPSEPEEEDNTPPRFFVPNEPGGSSPKTGDESSLWVRILLSLCALTGLAGVVILWRKRLESQADDPEESDDGDDLNHSDDHTNEQ